MHNQSQIKNKMTNKIVLKLRNNEEDEMIKQKKEMEEKIKMELRKKRDEDIKNGIRSAKNIDIEEEYRQLMSLERMTAEKLRLIDDQSNYNPIRDEYLNEIYHKYGSGLINMILNRKGRR